MNLGLKVTLLKYGKMKIRLSFQRQARMTIIIEVLTELSQSHPVSGSGALSI